MRPSTLNAVLFSVILGLAVGVGIFTFVYARGASYLTNDPAACANCHVMDEYYDAWLKGSHHSVAVCNDCHTPHTFVAKYMTKASNGFWHSFAFTTGNFPDPLRIKPGNHAVTEATCRSCHAPIVAAIDPGPHQTGTGSTNPASRDPGDRAHAGADESISCIRCHRSVGHFVR